ncbi:DNA methylase N-4 [Candidatus Parcubacteria bacterium]|nr:MAG: DNA methylase N-4 [Candidatus Parcubacteria bacterium]
MEYLDFIKSKIAISAFFGFDIKQSEINPLLKPHQKDIVQWAIKGGCRAIFASYGLGKTFCQLEILRIIGKKEKGKQLVIAPLGVRQEFKADAEKLNMDIRFVRWTEEVQEDGLYITNYESVRDGRLDINMFNAVSLDEASVLRSYGSLTFQTFLSIFGAVKYKFVATATPSPNRYKEIIHYSGFLGVMDSGQALTRFFKRDSTQANNLTLMPHMEKEFWLWVSSWALFLQYPSDLGYDNTEYNLPDLNIHYHEVKAGEVDRFDRRDGQRLMFGDSTLSLADAATEKRGSIENRVSEMLSIVKGYGQDQLIVWCDLDAEQKAIEKALKSIGVSYVSLYGGTNIDDRERLIMQWKNKEKQVFVSKPMMYGSGINMQQCYVEIFVGINFKANDFLQAIHRIFRFLQCRACQIHLIFATSELGILQVLKKKWANNDKMVGKMTDIIKKYGLSHVEMMKELERSIGIDRIEVAGKNFIVANNDCVHEAKLVERDSVGLIHTSIPFANHYEYTPSYNDFGFTKDNAHFWDQMDFLTPELYRMLSPGRIAAIHVKDRVLFGNVTGLGFPTCDNMHEETSAHFQKHGFKKIGMITIVTDVVRENNQTYRLGWTEQCKDGSKMGVGCPEYILLFRKPQTDKTKGFADVPVAKSKDDYTRAKWQIDAHAFWRSSGNVLLDTEFVQSIPTKELLSLFKKYQQEEIYNYDHHVKIGEDVDKVGKLPSTFMSIAPESHDYQVWTDINRMITLNSKQARRNVALHLCPLQIDTVTRIITRYSNEGDLVYDPFSGIGTVPIIALRLGRKGRGSELNHGYFLDSVKYLESEERNVKMPSLFDYFEERATA